jgi:hypothetical protein
MYIIETGCEMDSTGLRKGAVGVLVNAAIRILVPQKAETSLTS